jgi:hypothetical protein
MNRHAPAFLGVLAALLMLCTATASADGPVPGAAPTWDGLVLKPKSRVDAVYVQPGADIGVYTTVMLDPAQVSFAKNWDPNRSAVGVSDRLDADDVQAIRDGMAELFQEVFSEELGKGGYQLVDKPGHETLRVIPAIVDLYINAPERRTPGRVTTYTAEAGRMTLAVELRDSVTGDIIARAVDRYQPRQTGMFMMSSRNTNTAEARRAFREWASLLRKAMDEARERSD